MKAWKTIGAFALAAAGVISMVTGVFVDTHHSVGGRLAVILSGAAMISTGVLLLGIRVLENWLNRVFPLQDPTTSENPETDIPPSPRAQRRGR